MQALRMLSARVCLINGSGLVASARSLTRKYQCDVHITRNIHSHDRNFLKSGLCTQLGEKEWSSGRWFHLLNLSCFRGVYCVDLATLQVVLDLRSERRYLSALEDETAVCVIANICRVSASQRGVYIVLYTSSYYGPLNCRVQKNN